MRASFFGRLCLLCVAAACATNPVTHESEIAVISESGEIARGRDIDRYLVATHSVYDDSAWAGYLQELGTRLAARCERPGLPWTFRVLNAPAVNAFALPGGVVYVTRGMLGYLTSEAQLAAVLGHEIGHVAARHYVAQITRREMAGIGVMAATVAGSVGAGYASAAWMETLFLKNSRSAEKQADELGLHYMSEAGYDPAEMLTALRAVQGATGNGPMPEWLATHPTWEHRLENITQERVNLRGIGTVVAGAPYLRRLDGLVYGDDHRQGYFDGSRLVVPAQGYRLNFPSGWTHFREGASIRAETEAQEAVFELTETEQPTADSAARFFFKKLATSQGPATRDQVNGLTVVSEPFAWLPLWVKMRGLASFIEYHGTVYRVLGYAKNSRWSAYRERVEAAMQTFQPALESEMRRAEPLRIIALPLRSPSSLAAVLKERATPVDPTELVGINQVALDSLLPAGQVVKWVVDARLR